MNLTALGQGTLPHARGLGKQSFALCQKSPGQEACAAPPVFTPHFLYATFRPSTGLHRPPKGEGMRDIILIHVTGSDKPGVTAGLSEVLAHGQS